MIAQPLTRQQEIRAIWKQYQGLYVVAGILIGLLLYPLFDMLINDLGGLLFGLVPEAIGIGFTVFWLDRIYEYRDTEQLKKRLIRESGSSSNPTALSAVDWLNYEGWLRGRGGLLYGKPLSGANLNGAYLAYANLQRVNLRVAQLRKANLANADLRQAILDYATFEEANLFGANLEFANLEFSDLRGAMLHGANLQGANIIGADFDDAQLKDAMLPDGTSYKSDTDLLSFTDTNHPDFEATLSRVNDLRQIRGYKQIEFLKNDWILPDWLDEENSH